MDNYSMIKERRIYNGKKSRDFPCGAVEINLTRIHEHVGSFPSLTHWVGDLALP